MKKRTILQVFASRGWGGGEQYVYDLSQRLIEDGNKVFFFGKKSTIQEKKISPNKLYTLPFKGIIDLYSPFRLRSIIKKNDVDIVHIHQFKDAFTTMLAKFLLGSKLKIVLTRHLVKKAKSNFLYNLAYKSIDKIIFVSELAKSTFLSTQPHVDINKIEVVHNSIVPLKPLVVNDYNIRQQHHINELDCIFLYAGRLVEGKGIDVLLKTLPTLGNQNYKLIIAGTGDDAYKIQIQQLITLLNIQDKVIFLGFVEDIAALIYQIDIGLMPSVFPESFGLAAIEFMRGGKPVITTDNGAQKEFIRNNIDGILVPPKDTEALAHAIDELMADKAKRDLLGMNAKKHFNDKLNYDRFYNQIVQIYDNICDFQ